MTGKEHSLGRINIVETKSQGGIIVDGQQRLLTLVLLMVAIRDVALQTKVDSAFTLAKRVNSIVFPEQQAFADWLMNGGKITEGVNMEKFCVVVPTYFDRQAFCYAVLPASVRPKNVCIQGTKRPLECKKWFKDCLMTKKMNDTLTFNSKISSTVSDGDRFVEGLGILFEALLKFSVLYFGIDVSNARADGTDDLRVIFERLAVQNSTWNKPTRSSEGIAMSGVSFIRNIILACFSKETTAIVVYKKRWITLESKIIKLGVSLEVFFETFLKKVCGLNNSQDRIVGGVLYSRFRDWFERQIGKIDMEGDAVKVLCNLHDFAENWNRSRR